MQSAALVEHYSSKTDDELLALAANPSSLVEEAQLVLATELRRRNLAVLIPTSITSQSPHRNRPVANFSRTVGSLLLNLAIAVFGTAIIESSIWSRMGQSRSMFEVITREWLFSVTIAALLSYIVCRRRPNKAAMWVWVLPVLFLAFRVLLYATNKIDNSIWEHFLAPNCINGKAECRDFWIFTIVAARTVVYSLVGWVSWRLWPKKTDSPQV